LKHAVVFSEQFFFPDGWGGAQLPRDVTIHLARAGFAVEVICGSDQYAPVDGDPGQDPSMFGVRIRRLPRLLRGDIHRLKLLRQLWFYVLAFPLLLIRRRPDAFVTQTNPPLLVPAVALVAFLRRSPFIIVAQDLYPEVMIAYGMLDPRGMAGRLLDRLFRWAYRRARCVVALGPTMRIRLVEKGVTPDRIVVISNWSTGGTSVVRGPENQLRRKWGLDGKFVILYSGNIGIAHDIETPILALKLALARAPGVRLVFVGKGSRLAEARSLAAVEGVCDQVLFKSLVSMELLPQSMGLADLALVSLRDGFEGLVVPSKLFGYMARGIPTAYVGPPGDIQHFIEESGGGECVRNGAVEALAESFVRLSSNAEAVREKGRAAEEYYRAHLDQSIALDRYLSLMRQVCRGGGPARSGNRP
jgi:colanic acid biosynthesis glycosyl transferase WcaI